MPKELRKNEADFSWRRRRIFTGHGKYVRTPDSNYPKRRAEIITAQNKGCMIRAPCVSKPQHIFFLQLNTAARQTLTQRGDL